MPTTTPTTAPTLAEIDSAAKAYAAARKLVSERVTALQEEIAVATRRKIAGIKGAAEQAAALQKELRDLVAAAPELFVEPRTYVLHGIKCGYQKGKGSVVWDDNARTCALIRKHLPDQAEVLIISTEKPSADALRQLDTRDLARIGARLEGTDDQVMVKTSDTAVDKLVAKILEEGSKAAEE